MSWTCRSFLGNGPADEAPTIPPHWEEKMCTVGLGVVSDAALFNRVKVLGIVRTYVSELPCGRTKPHAHHQ